MESASCLIFVYGEMHEYLAWKRQASLNSFNNGFHGFMVLFEILRDLLSPMLFFVMMEVFSRMVKRMEGARLLKGFKADGRRGKGECVSHLLFADDTILFCDAEVEQILHIRLLLLCFQSLTGLKVNVAKSEMVPIGEVNNAHALAEILGCRVGALPMTYLDMPLGASHKSPSIWNLILEKN